MDGWGLDHAQHAGHLDGMIPVPKSPGHLMESKTFSEGIPSHTGRMV